VKISLALISTACSVLGLLILILASSNIFSPKVIGERSLGEETVKDVGSTSIVISLSVPAFSSIDIVDSSLKKSNAVLSKAIEARFEARALLRKKFRPVVAGDIGEGTDNDTLREPRSKENRSVRLSGDFDATGPGSMVELESIDVTRSTGNGDTSGLSQVPGIGDIGKTESMMFVNAVVTEGVIIMV